MPLKDKLPVSYLLFRTRGRINRRTYCIASIFIWTSFYVLFNALEYGISYGATWFIYPILLWSLLATAIKRLHDSDRNGAWLWLILIPVLGPLILLFLLGFKRGKITSNRFGPVPNSAPDYYKNEYAARLPGHTGNDRVVNDVTQINPIVVSRVETPQSIPELQRIIKNTKGKVSIGGGRFSMGGQTASPGSTHIDMRSLNSVISFDKEERIILVEAGIRWCDIQKFIDPHGLSVKIMQTYANFTVGGALSVNCHGRYIGLGSVILSVRSINIILANGEIKHASRQENAELFFACVGCYNAVAVIASVELDLEENLPVKRVHRKMKREEYRIFFAESVRDDKQVVFHNGDLYPPKYKNVRGVSWVKTTEKPTVKTKLMPLSAAYPIERYFISAFSRSRFGKWRRGKHYRTNSLSEQENSLAKL